MISHTDKKPWISAVSPGLIILLILGFIGNVTNLSVFFGVDVIFGSIATLIIIASFGSRWGILSSILASSYTLVLWTHPYAAMGLIGEAIFVSLVWRRLHSNIALSSGVYWFFIGMPLMWVCYRFGVGTDEITTHLVSLKQGMNGIINALVASLLLSYTPITSILGLKKRIRLTIFQSIFVIFSTAALLPSLVLVFFDSRVAINRIEEQSFQQIETLSSGLAFTIGQWVDQHTKAVVQIAELTEEIGSKDVERLQVLTEEISTIWSNFYGAYISDPEGTTVAYYPPVNALGESTIGINFSDREYFQRVKADKNASPFVSEVFQSRGSIFEPVINIVSRYEENGEFGGVVVATMNLEQLQQDLFKMPTEMGYIASLIDPNGFVIASSYTEIFPLMHFGSSLPGVIDDRGSGFFYRVSERTDQSPMIRWRQSTIGKSIDLQGATGWKLVIERPLAPIQNELYERYIHNLFILLFFILIVMVCSSWVASRVAQPIARLSEETTDIPEKIRSGKAISWPSSQITEFDVLIQNFRSMVIALKLWYTDSEATRKQLEKAKEEAERANRLKSSFLANMSHEIRTPLGVMIGFSDLVADENTSPEEKKQYAQTMKRNGEQLSVLINDILDLSKVEAGYLNVELENISLRSTLEDIADTFKGVVRSKGLRLLTKIDDDIPDQLVTDPVRLKQILTNLINNAVKFTERGEISVSVLENSGRLVIEVTDTGIGISTEDQTKLFRPFSQIDESMTRKYGGTGLGLALSKRLANLLGGDLILLNSETGKGSTFRLTTLNSSDKHTSIKRGSESKFVDSGAEKALAGLKGTQVLLVEDSPDNQLLLQRILKKVGVQVEFANNGLEGFEKAQSQDYDAVIMDLQMPVMDGYEATQKLRSIGFDKPIIALTAHVMSEEKEKCKEAGCTAHLAKPVNASNLYSTLYRYIKDSPTPSEP